MGRKLLIIVIAMVAVMFGGFNQSAQARGKYWGRVSFEERVKLLGQLKVAKKATRVYRQIYDGSRPRAGSLVLWNQGSYDRKVVITITPVNRRGWFRTYDQGQFEVQLFADSTFVWRNARYGRGYSVRVYDTFTQETVYEGVYVPTPRTPGYTLVIPGPEQSAWELEQRELQAQINELLVQSALSRDRRKDLEAQIEQLRLQMGQSQKG